jgi:hypothetical protein
MAAAIPLSRFRCRRTASAADHLAGLEALGAHVGLVTVPIGLNNRDALDVGKELAVGNAMRVADAAPSDGVLATD